MMPPPRRPHGVREWSHKPLAKCGLAMVSSPLEPSGMGSKRESPGTQVDRDQRGLRFEGDQLSALA